MGTALLSEYSHHSEDLSYALKAAEDILKLQNYLLIDQSEFILGHGYNARTGHHSCCKWARGSKILGDQ